ncbi:hypothetical protein R1flu_020761 [Riccia fluitans]|uniref:PRA1 family protein n=1 Tax=Riccia fluitans TaxID=41844 RepID=A0ABD1ZME9_9MARC
MDQKVAAFDSRDSGDTFGRVLVPNQFNERVALFKEEIWHQVLGSPWSKQIGRSLCVLRYLENVPVPAVGLGLSGAILFVALTPGIASILPLLVLPWKLELLKRSKVAPTSGVEIS